MDAGRKPNSNSKTNFSSIFSSPVSFFPAAPVCNFSENFQFLKNVDQFPAESSKNSFDPFSGRNNDAVLDSGCTSHTYPADAPAHNKVSTPPAHATKCLLPNGHNMTQTYSATLPIHGMPAQAKV